ncbi:pyridoxamine 5'-phosphate oxidase family protein [Lactobacillus selangorensis]|nr:pyridoxamine 5'-phosphate oxidase family protein [Lactobacillus selangorensis]
MAQITQDMKDMIAKQLAYIATVDTDGNPDVGPKMTMRLYDDSHLIYDEFTAKQTMKNIEATGKAAVAYVDRKAFKGFRFSGKAEIHTSGPYVDAEQAYQQQTNPKASVQQVGVIDIDEIHLLDIGPKAGTRIE